MKLGESTKIKTLESYHLEYVDTRKKLEEYLKEVKILRKKLKILDEDLRGFK